MAGETYTIDDPSCSNPYGRNPYGPTLHGIDVSEAQGLNFDWEKAAADNVRFAWMKATQGTGYEDKAVARNWRASKAAGLMRGLYHFQNPAANVDMQVANFLRTLDALGGLEDDDMHCMNDVEVSHGMSANDVAAVTLRWNEEVEKRTGREVVIYTGPSFWTASVAPGLSGPDMLEVGRKKLVIAHYVVDPASGKVFDLKSPIVPVPFPKFYVWQVTGNRGRRIPGTLGDEDRDVFWSDEVAFRNAFTKQQFVIYDYRSNPIMVGDGEHTVALDGDDKSGGSNGGDNSGSV